MEKYLTILQSQLSFSDNSIDDSFLDEYFKSINDDICSKIINNMDEWNQFFYKFNKIYKFNKSQVLFEIEIENLLKKILNSILSIKKTNRKEQVIPLIIYLDCENIFYKFLLKNSFFDALKMNFTKTVETSHIHLSNNNLPNNHWEIKAFNSYQEGIKTLDIKKIYHFISAHERGVSFLSNSYLDCSVLALYIMSFHDLVKIINEKKDVITIIYLISNLSIKQKLQLANYSQNMVLQFEVIREVINSTNKIDNNEKKLLSEIILKLSKDNSLWKQFLEYYLEYPSNSLKLFQPLATTLDNSEYQEIDLFINTITINKHMNQESINALNACIFNIKDDCIQKYIMENIFRRWQNYIEISEDIFLEICLTDVVSIICTYVVEFMTREQILFHCNKIIYELNEIDNKWFKNKTEYSKYLHKLLSKLYVYGFGAKRYNLLEIKTFITTFNNQSFELNNTTIQYFNEHILK